MGTCHLGPIAGARFRGPGAQFLASCEDGGNICFKMSVRETSCRRLTESPRLPQNAVRESRHAHVVYSL